jgi:NAD-dependent deacetylase
MTCRYIAESEQVRMLGDRVPMRNRRRLLVVTGAGISAESGIPTFRGSDGYWRHLDPTKLATEAAFRRDPLLVWDWYRERRAQIRLCQPNAAHEAVVQLTTLFPESLILTQNVDDLHARARWRGRQLSPEQIVQIHGDIFVTRCSACSHQLRDAAEDALGVPACTQCGQAMRPGVVWFGELLDPSQIQRVHTFLADGPCDLTIVVGTTATFGYIVDWSLTARGERGQLIEVNPAGSELSGHATEVVREPAAKALPEIAARFS